MHKLTEGRTGEYLALKDKLKQLPDSWYPELIKHLIIEALERKLFKRGGATHLCRKTERKFHKPLIESLYWENK